MTGSIVEKIGLAETHLLENPAAFENFSDVILAIDDPHEVFSWFRRLSIQSNVKIDGKILRKVLYAVGRVDVDMLRVFAESAPNRDYRIRSFIAAALLANTRVHTSHRMQVEFHIVLRPRLQCGLVANLRIEVLRRII